MNNHRQTFEAMLAADPYDTTTRLVYADWLDEHSLDAEAAEQRRMATPEWCAARKWLYAYAQNANPYDRERYVGGEVRYELIPDGEDLAFRRLIEGLQTRELYFHGTDLHGLYDLDDAEELREYAEVYFGDRKIDYSEFSFSCSC